MTKKAGLDWELARARLERVREAIEQSAAPTAEEKERAFRRRAEQLAQPLRPASETAGGDAVVVVRIGTQRYGFQLAAVAEVIPNPQCTPLPGAPSEVAGVIQVRGEIRPVCELSQVLGLPGGYPASGGTVLLLREGGREFGARVDAVDDIRIVPPSERRPPPQGDKHASWITHDLVTVLNPNSLLQGGDE
jgi:purine-binding chemotaxis protein CheW